MSVPSFYYIQLVTECNRLIIVQEWEARALISRNRQQLFMDRSDIGLSFFYSHVFGGKTTIFKVLSCFTSGGSILPLA